MIKLFNPILIINEENIFLLVIKDEERITLFEQENGLYKIEFKIYLTTTNINLTRFWKMNRETNIISIIDKKENININFKYAILVNDYAVNIDSESGIDIQFHAWNKEVVIL